MAQVTVQQVISGTVDGEAASLSTSSTDNYPNVRAARVTVTSAWKTITNFGTGTMPIRFVLANDGAEDAVYRIGWNNGVSTQYTVFDLPAGRAVCFGLNLRFPFGESPGEPVSNFELGVYSANGTTIRHVVCY